MTRKVLILLCIAVAIAGVVSWFASPSPDGLERVAIDHSFDETAAAPLVGILPDYSVPGLDGFWSHSIAGILGTIAVFGVVMIIGRVVKVKHHRE